MTIHKHYAFEYISWMKLTVRACMRWCTNKYGNIVYMVGRMIDIPTWLWNRQKLKIWPNKPRKMCGIRQTQQWHRIIYLWKCSIAEQQHKNILKRFRRGERNNSWIVMKLNISQGGSDCVCDTSRFMDAPHIFFRFLYCYWMYCSIMNYEYSWLRQEILCCPNAHTMESFL